MLSQWRQTRWITRPPARAAPHPDDMASILQDLVICHSCNTVMSHRGQGGQARYHCPGPGNGKACPHPDPDAKFLHSRIINRIWDQLTDGLTPEQSLQRAAKDIAPESARLAAQSLIDHIDLMAEMEATHPNLAKIGLQDHNATAIRAAMSGVVRTGQAFHETLTKELANPGPDSDDQISRYAMRTTIANPTPANRSIVRALVKVADPSPDRETYTTRDIPGGMPPDKIHIDDLTIENELLKRTGKDKA